MNPLADELEAALPYLKECCAAYEAAGVKANPIARDGAKVKLAVCRLMISIYNWDALKPRRRGP